MRLCYSDIGRVVRLAFVFFAQSILAEKAKKNKAMRRRLFEEMRELIMFE